MGLLHSGTRLDCTGAAVARFGAALDLHHSLRAAIGRGNCFHLLFRRFASLSMDQRMNWRRGSPASRLLCERHTCPKSLSVPTGSLSVPVGSDVLRKKLFY